MRSKANLSVSSTDGSSSKLPIALILLMLATLFGVTAVAYIKLNHASIEFAFFVFLLGIVAAFFEYATWDVFFARGFRVGPFRSPLASIAVLIVATILAATAIEALTLFGIPSARVSNLHDWEIVRLGIFAYTIYGVAIFLLWFFVGEDKPTVFGEIRRFLVMVPLREWLLGVVLLLVALACSMGAYFIFGMSLTAMLFFTISIALLVFALVLMRGHIGTHPEYAVFLIVVLLGFNIVAVPPVETGISPDDQIHYTRSLTFSYVTEVQTSPAEEQMRTVIAPSTTDVQRLDVTLDKALLDQDDIDYYNTTLDRVASESEYVDLGLTYSDLSYDYLGYAPAAFGLWLGRTLHLSLSMQVFLGKLFNLLFYAWCCFIAVRVIPKRKILFSAILMMPFAVFLAANYSYDSWTTGLLALAFAMTVREICSPDKLLTKRNAIVILAVFVIALAPKSIYFPLMGVLLIMPKSKFRSSRNRWLFIASACVCVCLVVVSFAAPFFASSDSRTDTRVYTDADASRQLAYVFESPLAVLAAMTSHIITVFVPVDFPKTIMSYGYLGSGFKWACYLYLFMLILLAFFDGSPEDNRYIGKGSRVWVFITLLCTQYLVDLALYISFTPVAANTVYGVQGRYMFPMLLPLLGICVPVLSGSIAKKKYYGLAVMALSAIFLACCNYFLLVSRIVA